MDFALMSCPYCGGVVDCSNPAIYDCTSCGKHIYTDRESLRHFVRPGELEGRYNEALDAIDDDNAKKALAIAEELLSVCEGDDADPYFLRGTVYAYMGEDGKAAIDWKKGMELLSVYSNLDAYICLMSRSISDMLYEKEKEYLDFDPIKYIDRLADEIYAQTSESCKSFFFYTVYRNYRALMGILQTNGEETFRDAIPRMFKRIVEYHRNFPCLVRIIDEYLVSMGYNPETYKEDDFDDLHVYDIIKSTLRLYLENMSEEEIKKLIHSWDDASLKGNEERLEAILPRSRGGVLGKFLAGRKGGSDSDDVNIPDAVDVYVRRCLLLDKPMTSEDPEVDE